MRGFSKRNKQLLLLIFILVLISAISIAIYSVNNSSVKNTNTIGSDLKGYATLKAKLNALKPVIDIRYQEALSEFNIVEDKNTSFQNRYNALARASLLLTNSYLRNHNSEIYNLVKNDLNNFAAENFKNYYNKSDFLIPCQDKSCAQSPIPTEISNIIDQINGFDNLASENKEMMISNLLYDSYMPSDNLRVKANAFLSTAYTIRTDKAYIDAGINNKIADEIEAFVKTEYPNYYKVFRP